MKSHSRFWSGFAGAVGLLILILDVKTALSGAKDGITLCFYTVIPSLFPFIVLSILLNSTLVSANSRWLRPLGTLCGTPAGSESLLLLGLLGGYPVGAQCVTESYRANRIPRQDAQRMLGFCSNAGPAFIFGMGSCLFETKATLWLLWGIHILSAFIVAALLPNKSKNACEPIHGRQLTISQALEKGIKTIAVVCGWVVLFRLLLAFLQRWFLWMLPTETQVFIAGLLELSNGCYELTNITSIGTRFIFCSGMLGFGGICVAMQTVSVTKDLGTGMYFPGKVLHGAFSIILSGLLQSMIFSGTDRCILPALGAAAALLATVTLLIIRRKKRVAIFC